LRSPLFENTHAIRPEWSAAAKRFVGNGELITCSSEKERGAVCAMEKRRGTPQQKADA